MMKITKKFSDDLLNALAMLAVCANGRTPETEEEIKGIEEYARKTYLSIMDEWEETTSLKWEVVD